MNGLIGSVKIMSCGWAWVCTSTQKDNQWESCIK